MAASSSPNLHGKVCVVVGGTSGIGKGFCEWFAMHGASVVVSGRSKESGAEVVELLGQVAPPGLDPAPQHSFIPVNCLLIGDTRRFVREVQQAHNRLDYLVLTAGTGAMQGRVETAEGIDEKLAVHCYGRMAVVEGFLPLMEKTAGLEGADVRVLNVMSGGIHSTYPHYREDVDVKQNYTFMNAAHAAGFYTDIILDSFAREHPAISLTHAYPGLVASNWGREFPLVLRLIVHAVKLFGKTPLQCAQTLSPSLLSPEFRGGFFVMTKDGTRGTTAPQHEEAREFVWDHAKAIFARFPRA